MITKIIMSKGYSVRSMQTKVGQALKFWEVPRNFLSLILGWNFIFYQET